MKRVLLTAAATAALFIACAAPPRFQDMRTPSGEFCTDMPIYSGKTQPEREFHRLEPVQSEPGARTEPERLRSLRKAACLAGGDAVIEAVEDDIRLPDASYGKVAAGTAIVWTRREGEAAKPLDLGAKTEEDLKKEAETPPPEPPPAKEPKPLDTSFEVKSPPPSATTTATAAPSATAPAPTTTATGSTTKTKTTTKTTTKK